MNVFDYFFEKSKVYEKDFVLNSKEKTGYKELYSTSIKLAEYLKSTTSEGEKILILSRNTKFFIIAYLAILKAGRICVPLSPDTESVSFKYIKNQCKPNLLFIQESLLDKFDTSGINCLTEVFFIEKLALSPLIENIDLTFDSNTCAEIIYTSGSTGLPKGVMISHKNLISNTQSIIDYLQLSENDTMLVVLPFYYCYGLSLLHTHLRIGGSIALNNNFMFLGTVLNDLVRYNCTGFAGVPSHFQILLRKSNTFKNTRYPHLRYVTQAGGKLHAVFIEEFIEAQPNVQFYEMYGQTEATARLSYLPPTLLPEKIGSLGRGIPGVTLRVVNESGKDIIPGETGEIIAKGENIMLGYLDDDKTTQQTIKDGWLYTGDLATIDSDGYIYLISRTKEIIKVGGRRISPKEIEEVIFTIPQIVDCTIEAVNDDVLGEAVKAIIVIDGADKELITKEYIWKYCASKLAIFKIPKYIEIQDRIVLSPTGKKVKASR